MEKLKPCPFCGGEAKISAGKKDGFKFVIWCEREKCYANSTGYVPTLDNSDLALGNIESCKNNAIEAWNRRVKE